MIIKRFQQATLGVDDPGAVQKERIMFCFACVEPTGREQLQNQGWQVSPHHGKKHGNYSVSANTAEILSAQGTKFGENYHENIHLIETLTV